MVESGLCLMPDRVEFCLVLIDVSCEFFSSRLNLYLWIDGIFMSGFRFELTNAIFGR